MADAQQFSVDEFAARVKAQYPDYQSMDNAALVEKMLAKYPEYKNSVRMHQAAVPPDAMAQARQAIARQGAAMQPMPFPGMEQLPRPPGGGEEHTLAEGAPVGAAAMATLGAGAAMPAGLLGGIAGGALTGAGGAVTSQLARDVSPVSKQSLQETGGAAAGGAALGGLFGAASPAYKLARARFAIQPTEKAYRYGKTPVETVLEMQKTGELPATGARKPLLEAINSKIDSVMAQIDGKVKAAPSNLKADVTSALDAIDQRLMPLHPDMDQPLVDQLMRLRRAVRDSFNDLKNAGATELQAAKRQVDTVINYQSSPEARKFLDAAKGEVRHIMDTALDNMLPGHEGLNQTASSLIAARDALAPAARREAAGRLSKSLASKQTGTVLRRLARIAPWIAVGWPLERAILRHRGLE